MLVPISLIFLSFCDSINPCLNVSISYRTSQFVAAAIVQYKTLTQLDLDHQNQMTQTQLDFTLISFVRFDSKLFFSFKVRSFTRSQKKLPARGLNERKNNQLKLSSLKDLMDVICSLFFFILLLLLPLRQLFCCAHTHSDRNITISRIWINGFFSSNCCESNFFFHFISVHFRCCCLIRSLKHS